MVREDLLIKRKREVLIKTRLTKRLDNQYKRVIDDLYKTIKWWETNAWKATFISLLNRIKGRR